MTWDVFFVDNYEMNQCMTTTTAAAKGFISAGQPRGLPGTAAEKYADSHIVWLVNMQLFLNSEQAEMIRSYNVRQPDSGRYCYPYTLLYYRNANIIVVHTFYFIITWK